MILTRILKTMNHTITSTYDGEELLDTYIKNKGNYDLVISDTSMPKMDGFQACKRIMDFKFVPCMLMSADENIELVKNDKFIYFIIKPITYEKIEIALNYTLSP